MTLYVEEDGEEITCQIVTTMRQDALKGRVSKESPGFASQNCRWQGEKSREYFVYFKIFQRSRRQFWTSWRKNWATASGTGGCWDTP